MLMRVLLLWCGLWGGSGDSVFAQQETAKAGIDRVIELYERTEVSRSASAPEAITQGQSALAILDHLPESPATLEWRALVLTNIAWAEGVLSNYQTAFSVAKNALNIAERAKSDKARARCLNTIAILNREIGSYDEALDLLQQVLVLERSLGNHTRTLTTRNNLGLLLVDMDRPNDALGIFLDALQQAEPDVNPLSVTRVRINMSEALIGLQEFQKAVDELTEVAEQSPDLPMNMRALLTRLLGQAYFGLGNITAADTLTSDALVYWQTVQDAGDIIETHVQLAKIKSAQNQLKLAERHLLEAELLARESGKPQLLREVVAALSRFYENVDLNKALIYARQESQLREKVFSDSLAKRLGQFQTRLEQSERENQIDLLRRENELKAIQVEQQRNYLYLSVGAVLFILLLMVFLIYRLKVRRHMLDATSMARERALAQISHEFRTPLTGIIGVSELLQKTQLTPEQRELLRTINYSGESLLGLVNDLLDVSQLDAGKLVLQQKPFDLRELLESVLELFSLIVEEKGISLAYRLGLCEVTEVTGDPQRLRQILVNLVSNAIKFTDRGSVVLNVHWQHLRKDYSELIIEVQDTGIGIRDSQLRRLFEPFAQADDGIGKGTGLGLSISRQIARQMGGDITVTSTPQIGSCFTVKVHLQPREWQANDLKHLPLPYVAGWQLPEALAGVAAEYLLEVGVALERVNTLEQIERLKAPKVFLMLAGSDNRETVNTLLQHWHDSHVLLLASPRARLQWEAHPMPRVSILNRPLRPGELVTFLSAIVNKAPLPKPDPVPVNEPSISVTVEAAEPETPTRQSEKTRALVVDDNEVNRVITRRMLERMHVAVEVCADGSEAVRATMQDSYDIIFMDCQMPELDGYQATAEIRRQEQEQGRSSTVIVAMTANAMDGDKERCLSVGMNDYLAKPIRMEDLARMLGKYQFIAAD